MFDYRTIHLKYVNESHSDLTYCQRPHNFCQLKYSLYKVELIKKTMRNN